MANPGEITVRATGIGYYDVKRKPGDVFDIPEKLFSETWMEKGRRAPKTGEFIAESEEEEAKPAPKSKAKTSSGGSTSVL